MKKMCFLLTTLCLLTASIGFTANADCCPKPFCPKDEDPSCNKFLSIKPQCVDVKGWKYFTVTGEFLYWFQKQKGIDFVFTSQNPFLNPIEKGQLVSPKFSYHPGVRVGVGGNFDRNQINLEWTHFVNYSSKTVEPPRGGSLVPFIPLFPFEPVSSETSSATAKLNFNMIDLTLFRPYYIGQNWIFRPYYGLKGFWTNSAFDQQHDLALLFAELPVFPPIFDTVLLPDEFLEFDALRFHRNYKTWNFGPKIGLGFDWFFTEGFSLFSQGGLTIFYSRSEVDLLATYPTFADQIGAPSDILLEISNKKENAVKAAIEGKIGLSWGKIFQNKYHTDFSLAYEWLYLAEHYQYDSFAESLIFHGLSAKVQLDF